MKKIAIVTPGILPVPAVCGGAVETLITYLIDRNEKTPEYYFIIYTCSNEKLNKFNYKYTVIKQIKYNKYLNFLCRALSWMKRHFHIGIIVNAYQMCLLFQNWKQQDYILVENSLAVYEWLNHLQSCSEKMIYHMHNDIENETGDKSPKRVEIAAKTSLMVLVCSNYLKEQVKSIYNGGKTEVLYNCIDESLFDVEKADERIIKKKHGICKDDFVVMYSGRIAEEKGVRELAAAMKQICLNHTNVKFLIIGCCWFPDVMESDYMDEIRKIIEPFQNQVIFAGYIPVEQIHLYYMASSAVAIPSICEEAFGIVSLEAMAMKKPLIVADAGGLPEAADEKCAIFVKREPDFIKSLERAVLKLYRNQELCKSMGEAGYQRLKKHKEFQRDCYFENFVKFIHSIEK